MEHFQAIVRLIEGEKQEVVKGYGHNQLEKKLIGKGSIQEIC